MGERNLGDFTITTFILRSINFVGSLGRALGAVLSLPRCAPYFILCAQGKKVSSF